MTMSVNFHGIEKCEASELPNVENDVLKIYAKDGSVINMYMPMAIAQAMADAFRRAKDHEKWLETMPLCDTCGLPDEDLDEAGECLDCVDKRNAEAYAKYRPLYEAEKRSGLLKSREEWEQEMRDAGRGHLIGDAAIGGE